MRSRARILEAAQGLLLTDPHAGMTAIAARAAVGRVTLYAHFESRERLVVELFDTHLACVRDVLGASDPAVPARERVSAFIRDSWQVMGEFDGLLVAAEAELGAARVREAHAEILAGVAAVIDDGRAAGEFRTGQSAAWLAEVFFVLLHGAAAARRNDGSQTDDGARIADDLVVTVLAALVAEPPTAEQAVEPPTADR